MKIKLGFHDKLAINSVAFFLFVCGAYNNRFELYDVIYPGQLQCAEVSVRDCRFHLKYDPSNWQLHHDLAHHLDELLTVTSDEQKRLLLVHEAIREYTIATKLNPNDAEGYFDLANIYAMELKDLHTANLYYEKCVALKPSSLYFKSFSNINSDALDDMKNANRHELINRLPKQSEKQ